MSTGASRKSPSVRTLAWLGLARLYRVNQGALKQHTEHLAHEGILKISTSMRGGSTETTLSRGHPPVFKHNIKMK